MEQDIPVQDDGHTKQAHYPGISLRMLGLTVDKAGSVIQYLFKQESMVIGKNHFTIHIDVNKTVASTEEVYPKGGEKACSYEVM